MLRWRAVFVVAASPARSSPPLLVGAGWGIALAGLALCSGCSAGDDSSAACSDVEAAVTWENWGAGFFSDYCRTCHSASSVMRRGAPPGVDFDSLVEVQNWAAAIRLQTLDTGAMPVGGGVPPEALEQLDVFLRCGL